MHTVLFAFFIFIFLYILCVSVCAVSVGCLFQAFLSHLLCYFSWLNIWYLLICFYTSHGFTFLSCWFICNCTCNTVVHVSFCFCSLFFVVSFVCDHFQVWNCFSLEFLFSALYTVCLCVQCALSFHTGLCYCNAVHKQSQLNGEKKSHCIRIRSKSDCLSGQFSWEMWGLCWGGLSRVNVGS